METNTETTETETPDVATEEATTDVEVTETQSEEPKTPVERPQPTSRRDRKRERIDVEAAQKQAAETRQQLEQERQERARIDRELAELKSQWQQTQRQTQTQTKAEQAKGKIQQLRDQAWMHMERAAVAKDPQSALHERQEYQRLMDEAEDTRREIWAEQERERMRGEIAQNGTDPALLEEKMYLSSRYPWLESNIEARALADGRFNALVGSGKQPSRQLMEEAITWSAARLGLGGQSAPSNQQKQLYSGVSAMQGPGNGTERKSIKVGRHEEALAKAAYPQLEAKDAIKQWARDMAEHLNEE